VQGGKKGALASCLAESGWIVDPIMINFPAVVEASCINLALMGCDFWQLFGALVWTGEDLEFETVLWCLCCQHRYSTRMASKCSHVLSRQVSLGVVCLESLRIRLSSRKYLTAGRFVRYAGTAKGELVRDVELISWPLWREWGLRWEVENSGYV